MTKAQTAIKFARNEFNRGLPVYLFEVADFFTGPTAFANARKVMAKLVDGQEAIREVLAEGNERYEAGARFWKVAGGF